MRAGKQLQHQQEHAKQAEAAIVKKRGDSNAAMKRILALKEQAEDRLATEFAEVELLRRRDIQLIEDLRHVEAEAYERHAVLSEMEKRELAWKRRFPEDVDHVNSPMPILLVDKTGNSAWM